MVLKYIHYLHYSKIKILLQLSITYMCINLFSPISNELSDRHLPSHYAGLAWEIATSPIVMNGRSAAQPRVGTHKVE